jgi:hypothetical protein
MRGMILTVVVVSLVSGAIVSADEAVRTEVRSPSGKLLFKIRTQGNTSDIRNAGGRLLMKSRSTNGGTEVRSPSGKLIYRTK